MRYLLMLAYVSGMVYGMDQNPPSPFSRIDFPVLPHWMRQSPNLSERSGLLGNIQVQSSPSFRPRCVEEHGGKIACCGCVLCSSSIAVFICSWCDFSAAAGIAEKIEQCQGVLPWG